MLISAAYIKFSPMSDFQRRMIKYSTAAQRRFSKHLPALLAIFGLFLMSFNFLDTVYEMTWKIFLYIAAQLSLSLIYIVLLNGVVRRLVSWRAPELTLVRALADAFETVAEGSPGSWRSISRRRKCAQYIDTAARTLEGPIAHKFVVLAGPGGAAAIQERLLKAGAALRSKIAWLATPKAETREFLARALARELLIAAAGDLDRLECGELESAGPRTEGWLVRLRARISWAAFGFGPAVFVVLSKWAGWFPDPATTGILVQFAALCFFVAVLSVTDPTGYKDRLGSVTGTGAALFGWKRP